MGHSMRLSLLYGAFCALWGHSFIVSVNGNFNLANLGPLDVPDTVPFDSFSTKEMAHVVPDVDYTQTRVPDSEIYEDCKRTHNCFKGYSEWDVINASWRWSSSFFLDGDRDATSLFLDFEDWKAGVAGTVSPSDEQQRRNSSWNLYSSHAETLQTLREASELDSFSPELDAIKHSSLYLNHSCLVLIDTDDLMLSVHCNSVPAVPYRSVTIFTNSSDFFYNLPNSRLKGKYRIFPINDTYADMHTADPAWSWLATYNPSPVPDLRVDPSVVIQCVGDVATAPTSLSDDATWFLTDEEMNAEEHWRFGPRESGCAQYQAYMYHRMYSGSRFDLSPVETGDVLQDGSNKTVPTAVFHFDSLYLGPNVRVEVKGSLRAALVSRSAIVIDTPMIVPAGSLGGHVGAGGPSATFTSHSGGGAAPEREMRFTVVAGATEQAEVQEIVVVKLLSEPDWDLFTLSMSLPSPGRPESAWLRTTSPLRFDAEPLDVEKALNSAFPFLGGVAVSRSVASAADTLFARTGEWDPLVPVGDAGKDGLAGFRFRVVLPNAVARAQLLRPALVGATSARGARVRVRRARERATAAGTFSLRLDGVETPQIGLHSTAEEIARVLQRSWAASVLRAEVTVHGALSPQHAAAGRDALHAGPPTFALHSLQSGRHLSDFVAAINGLRGDPRLNERANLTAALAARLRATGPEHEVLCVSWPAYARHVLFSPEFESETSIYETSQPLIGGLRERHFVDAAASGGDGAGDDATAPAAPFHPLSLLHAAVTLSPALARTGAPAQLAAALGLSASHPALLLPDARLSDVMAVAGTDLLLPASLLDTAGASHATDMHALAQPLRQRRAGRAHRRAPARGPDARSVGVSLSNALNNNPTEGEPSDVFEASLGGALHVVRTQLLLQRARDAWDRRCRLHFSASSNNNNNAPLRTGSRRLDEQDLVFSYASSPALSESTATPLNLSTSDAHVDAARAADPFELMFADDAPVGGFPEAAAFAEDSLERWDGRGWAQSGPLLGAARVFTVTLTLPPLLHQNHSLASASPLGSATSTTTPFNGNLGNAGSTGIGSLSPELTVSPGSWALRERRVLQAANRALLRSAARIDLPTLVDAYIASRDAAFASISLSESLESCSGSGAASASSASALWASSLARAQLVALRQFPGLNELLHAAVTRARLLPSELDGLRTAGLFNASRDHTQLPEHLWADFSDPAQYTAHDPSGSTLAPLLELGSPVFLRTLLLIALEGVSPAFLRPTAALLLPELPVPATPQPPAHGNSRLFHGDYAAFLDEITHAEHTDVPDRADPAFLAADYSETGLYLSFRAIYREMVTQRERPAPSSFAGLAQPVEPGFSSVRPQFVAYDARQATALEDIEYFRNFFGNAQDEDAAARADAATRACRAEPPGDRRPSVAAATALLLQELPEDVLDPVTPPATTCFGRPSLCLREKQWGLGSELGGGAWTAVRASEFAAAATVPGVVFSQILTAEDVVRARALPLHPLHLLRTLLLPRDFLPADAPNPNLRAPRTTLLHPAAQQEALEEETLRPRATAIQPILPLAQGLLLVPQLPSDLLEDFESPEAAAVRGLRSNGRRAYARAVRAALARVPEIAAATLAAHARVPPPRISLGAAGGGLPPEGWVSVLLGHFELTPHRPWLNVSQISSSIHSEAHSSDFSQPYDGARGPQPLDRREVLRKYAVPGDILRRGGPLDAGAALLDAAVQENLPLPPDAAAGDAVPALLELHDARSVDGTNPSVVPAGFGVGLDGAMLAAQTAEALLGLLGLDALPAGSELEDAVAAGSMVAGATSSLARLRARAEVLQRLGTVAGDSDTLLLPPIGLHGILHAPSEGLEPPTTISRLADAYHLSQKDWESVLAGVSVAAASPRDVDAWHLSSSGGGSASAPGAASGTLLTHFGAAATLPLLDTSFWYSAAEVGARGGRALHAGGAQADVSVGAVMAGRRSLGGSGGGALLLVATTDLTVGANALLSCNGRAGLGGGGHGAGGFIRLSALGAVVVDGALQAQAGTLKNPLGLPQLRTRLSDSRRAAPGVIEVIASFLALPQRQDVCAAPPLTGAQLRDDEWLGRQWSSAEERRERLLARAELRALLGSAAGALRRTTAARFGPPGAQDTHHALEIISRNGLVQVPPGTPLPLQDPIPASVSAAANHPWWLVRRGFWPFEGSARVEDRFDADGSLHTSQPDEADSRAFFEREYFGRRPPAAQDTQSVGQWVWRGRDRFSASREAAACLASSGAAPGVGSARVGLAPALRASFLFEGDLAGPTHTALAAKDPSLRSQGLWLQPRANVSSPLDFELDPALTAEEQQLNGGNPLFLQQPQRISFFASSSSGASASSDSLGRGWFVSLFSMSTVLQDAARNFTTAVAPLFPQNLSTIEPADRTPDRSVFSIGVIDGRWVWSAHAPSSSVPGEPLPVHPLLVSREFVTDDTGLPFWASDAFSLSFDVPSARRALSANCSRYHALLQPWSFTSLAEAQQELAAENLTELNATLAALWHAFTSADAGVPVDAVSPNAHWDGLAAHCGSRAHAAMGYGMGSAEDAWNDLLPFASHHFPSAVRGEPRDRRRAAFSTWSLQRGGQELPGRPSRTYSTRAPSSSMQTPQVLSEQWQKVDLMLDWHNRTLRARVNDVLVLLRLPLLASSVDFLQLSALGGGARFDELAVGEDDTLGFDCPLGPLPAAADAHMRQLAADWLGTGRTTHFANALSQARRPRVNEPPTLDNNVDNHNPLSLAHQDAERSPDSLSHELLQPAPFQNLAGALVQNDARADITAADALLARIVPDASLPHSPRRADWDQRDMGPGDAYWRVSRHDNHLSRREKYVHEFRGGLVFGDGAPHLRFRDDANYMSASYVHGAYTLDFLPESSGAEQGVAPGGAVTPVMQQSGRVVRVRQSSVNEAFRDLTGQPVGAPAGSAFFGVGSLKFVHDRPAQSARALLDLLSDSQFSPRAHAPLGTDELYAPFSRRFDNSDPLWPEHPLYNQHARSVAEENDENLGRQFGRPLLSPQAASLSPRYAAPTEGRDWGDMLSPFGSLRLGLGDAPGTAASALLFASTNALNGTYHDLHNHSLASDPSQDLYNNSNLGESGEDRLWRLGARKGLGRSTWYGEFDNHLFLPYQLRLWAARERWPLWGSWEHSFDDEFAASNITVGNVGWNYSSELVDAPPYEEIVFPRRRIVLNHSFSLEPFDEWAEDASSQQRDVSQFLQFVRLRRRLAALLQLGLTPSELALARQNRAVFNALFNAAPIADPLQDAYIPFEDLDLLGGLPVDFEGFAPSDDPDEAGFSFANASPETQGFWGVPPRFVQTRAWYSGGVAACSASAEMGGALRFDGLLLHHHNVSAMAVHAEAQARRAAAVLRDVGLDDAWVGPSGADLRVEAANLRSFLASAGPDFLFENSNALNLTRLLETEVCAPWGNESAPELPPDAQALWTVDSSAVLPVVRALFDPATSDYLLPDAVISATPAGTAADVAPLVAASGADFAAAQAALDALLDSSDAALRLLVPFLRLRCASRAQTPKVLASAFEPALLTSAALLDAAVVPPPAPPQPPLIPLQSPAGVVLVPPQFGFNETRLAERRALPFVMWYGVNGLLRRQALLGVARAARARAPFRPRRAFHPDGNRTMDFTLIPSDDGSRVLLARSFLATAHFILPASIMQPVWESVKDIDGEVDFALTYHRGVYHSGYDDPDDIWRQRWRREDKPWNVTAGGLSELFDAETREFVLVNVSDGSEVARYAPSNRTAELDARMERGVKRVFVGTGLLPIVSRFLDPFDPSNSVWQPSSVPAVKSQPWSFNYRDRNIADNPVHPTVVDLLIGLGYTVEARRARFVAVSLLDESLERPVERLPQRIIEGRVVGSAAGPGAAPLQASAEGINDLRWDVYTAYNASESLWDACDPQPQPDDAILDSSELMERLREEGRFVGFHNLTASPELAALCAYLNDTSTSEYDRQNPYLLRAARALAPQHSSQTDVASTFRPVTLGSDGPFNFRTEHDWQTRHWQYLEEYGDRALDFRNFRDRQVDGKCPDLHSLSLVVLGECQRILNHRLAYEHSTTQKIADETEKSFFYSMNTAEYEDCIKRHQEALQRYQDCLWDKEPDLETIPEWSVGDRECVGGGGRCGPPVDFHGEGNEAGIRELAPGDGYEHRAMEPFDPTKYGLEPDVFVPDLPSVNASLSSGSIVPSYYGDTIDGHWPSPSASPSARRRLSTYFDNFGQEDE